MLDTWIHYYLTVVLDPLLFPEAPRIGVYCFNILIGFSSLNDTVKNPLPISVLPRSVKHVGVISPFKVVKHVLSGLYISAFEELLRSPIDKLYATKDISLTIEACYKVTTAVCLSWFHVLFDSFGERFGISSVSKSGFREHSRLYNF